MMLGEEQWDLILIYQAAPKPKLQVQHYHGTLVSSNEKDWHLLYKKEKVL